MTQPIIEAAQALAGLLRAADDAGLPAPYSAEAREYAPHAHPAGDEAPLYGRVGGIELVIDADGLTAWSEWLDSEPYDDGKPYKGSLHRHVNGWSGPIPVRVTALVPVAEAVAR